jgi:hypothetical protein
VLVCACVWWVLLLLLFWSACFLGLVAVSLVGLCALLLSAFVYLRFSVVRACCAMHSFRFSRSVSVFSAHQLVPLLTSSHSRSKAVAEGATSTGSSGSSKSRHRRMRSKHTSASTKLAPASQTPQPTATESSPSTSGEFVSLSSEENDSNRVRSSNKRSKSGKSRSVTPTEALEVVAVSRGISPRKQAPPLAEQSNTSVTTPSEGVRHAPAR